MSVVYENGTKKYSKRRDDIMKGGGLVYIFLLFFSLYEKRVLISTKFHIFFYYQRYIFFVGKFSLALGDTFKVNEKQSREKSLRL